MSARVENLVDIYIKVVYKGAMLSQVQSKEVRQAFKSGMYQAFITTSMLGGEAEGQEFYEEVKAAIIEYTEAEGTS